MSTAVLLLAAGQSRRFGPEDKLLAPLGTSTVVGCTSAVLAKVPGEVKLAVVSSPKVAQLVRAAGFEVHMIPPGGPQSLSLKEGVERLERHAPARLLVALGDMPFVEPGDLVALLDLGGADAACMEKDGVPMPPAVFPARMFGALQMLEGDRGASKLLRDIPHHHRLPLPPQRLLDIDRPEDMPPGTPRTPRLGRAGSS